MNTLLGVTGALLLLIAFIQEQRGKWKRTDTIYDSINFLGAALMFSYAIVLSAWPFAVLNAIWALWSLKDLVVKK